MLTDTVGSLNAAMIQLREQQEIARLLADPQNFDPSPSSALGRRALAIQELFNKLPSATLAEYLTGLGYVRERLIEVRGILNVEGKKKFEAYIKDAVEALPVRFCGLKSYYLKTLQDIMSIPFRRSEEKDKREISDSLCKVASLIEKYRYHGADTHYRDYAQTIVRSIDTEQLPPMIASLIIQEITSLVSTATSSGVLTYVGSGLTHEEFWRHVDPEEFADAHDCGEIPNDTSPLEKLDIYKPQLGIARQSLWFDLDDYVDDFIASLAGGLIHKSSLSEYSLNLQL